MPGPGPKPATRWLRALPVAVAMVIGVGVGAPAHAHNQLTASTPEDGAVLDEAPARVTLDFLAALDPETTTVTVTGLEGRSAADGQPRFEGSTVTVPLRVSYAGRYTVAYEVLGSDGHPATGEVTFRLTPQAAPTFPPSPSPEPSPAPSATPAREAAAAPATPSAAAVSRTTPSETGPWWPWAIAAAAALLLLGLGAVSLARRGR